MDVLSYNVTLTTSQGLPKGHPLEIARMSFLEITQAETNARVTTTALAEPNSSLEGPDRSFIIPETGRKSLPPIALAW